MVAVLDDGRIHYETKRGQVLHFTPEAFVRRLSALVPPKGMHLTVGYGVFASASSMREQLMKATEVPAKPQANLPFLEWKKKPKRPRIDWADLKRRTFKEDVLQCACGGRRRVLAAIRRYDEARAMLERMGVEVPPTKIRERDQGLPGDKKLKLAV